MAKALTKEDLLYILQSIFRLSVQDKNAFQMLNDGLYVEDYHPDLSAHTKNSNIHIDEVLKNMLSGFSASEAGDLFYNGMPVNMTLSQKEGNGLTVEEDGLYMPNVAQGTAAHIIDEEIHVTAEDKETWNNTLENAKEFTLNEIKRLVIYDMQIVTELPVVSIEPPESSDGTTGDTETETDSNTLPKDTTLYLLANDPDCPGECTYTMYMFLRAEWVKLGITNQTLSKFVLKTEAQSALDSAHGHDNYETLKKFTETEDGTLLYNGTNIQEVGLSTKEKNAATFVDGQLYVPDYAEEIKAMQVTTAFVKIVLLDQELTESGVYELKDYIDNYSLLLVEYYYRPSDDDEQPGCAKTAVIDTDVLNDLHEKGMDYMLEYGYGISVANSKINMNKNKIWVNYYHNVCIYRITGIRRGED